MITKRTAGLLGAVSAAILVVALGTATAAEWIPPYEFSFYRFAAETRDGASTFLNPAGLAGGVGTNLSLELSGNEDVLDEFVAAMQGGPWGFAYRHRDLTEVPRRVYTAVPSAFAPGQPIIPVPADANLDAYTFGAAVGPRWFKLGAARVWGNVDEPGADLRTWILGFQSRPARRLSLGFTVRNPGHPDYLDARLDPRYTYGVALRPLPASPELLTLNVEGSHADGSSRIDMAYGARVFTRRGLEVALAVRDRNGLSPEFGLSVTGHFGHGAASARGRSVEGTGEDVRGSVGIQVFDEFWRRSMAPRKSVAVLRLDGTYEDTGSGFVLLGSETRGALDVIRRIRDAGRDPDVSALALRIGNVSGSFLGPVSAQIEEIRKALTAFRDGGKPVVAYLEDVGGAPEMYLASAADRIVMPPLTGVQGIGVSVHITRMKRMFEKLGVQWDADTAGVYKSTFHTWYTDTTSAAQRKEIESLVDVSYRHLIDTIQSARGISDEDMASIGTGRIVFPEDCVKMKLVDELGWWEDALKTAGELTGGPPDRKPSTMPLPDRIYWSERWVPPPAVAVVPAYGDIVSGKSRRNWIRGGRTMGSETVVRQLRAAVASPAVKAVVLRVDSGGGAVLASEEMRKEILHLKEERKIPFLVSMGSMAASGGYWISMDADTILADAMTLTGSIGVVWSLPVLQDLYEKAGLTSETFKRGEHTDMFSWYRHYTPEEKRMLDASLDYLYDAFIRGVAEGRGLPEARVREMAQGRVYFGERARELGLVDGIGTLGDAERVAAAKAGVADDYRVVTFGPPARAGLLTRILAAAGLRTPLAGDLRLPLLAGDPDPAPPRPVLR
jgi:protease-4